MLTTEQCAKILKLAIEIERDSNDLAVEMCEGYSYSGIERCKRDLAKSKQALVDYLEELKA
ncbi:hypothetical protein KNT86_gp179 [Enterobacteria phage vB_EcoM_IME341]|nr:hypothetical protein BOW90_gp094 [Escherichia phage MX01]YP_010094853.1 hypothetical protein KNT86_gp179 [Enterobacteria phage vB_EcoM_IME341]AND76039.1 hypothetical protein MX01_94 [Escherichia phage MX01]AWD92106.1 hypothetical protein [Enterobacteria phage vB_EcoM_IME341]QAY00127.1 hypothetical protein EcWhh1_197 [Escherichia phage EcWhh-1]